MKAQPLVFYSSRLDLAMRWPQTEPTRLISTLHCVSTGEATRTPDLRIMRPQPEALKQAIGDRSAPHLPTDTYSSDPELREIVDSWDALPQPVRASVLMLVRAGAKERTIG